MMLIWTLAAHAATGEELKAAIAAQQDAFDAQRDRTRKAGSGLFWAGLGTIAGSGLVFLIADNDLRQNGNAEAATTVTVAIVGMGVGLGWSGAGIALQSAAGPRDPEEE